MTTGRRVEVESTHTQPLAIRIHVVVPACSIGILVVRDVIDLILVQEGLVDDPRRVGDDLVNPAAVARGFEARCVCVSWSRGGKEKEIRR
jgi:hypothetical protein